MTLHLAFVVTQFFRRKPRIVPYFSKRLDARAETWAAFRAGFSVAAALESLDNIAVGAGAVPLSTFGFTDDAYGQPVVWHPPAEALQTVSGLIEQLRATEAKQPGVQSLILDLEMLAATLRKAIQSEASFCLIIRGGDDRYISPSEMDHRQGSFW